MTSSNAEKYIYLPMMTVGEAARYLGVGRKIVYQLIEYDQLKTVRNNGAVRIEKRTLDEIKSSGIIP
jgi:excisionase family DNA binding protein